MANDHFCRVPCPADRVLVYGFPFSIWMSISDRFEKVQSPTDFSSPKLNFFFQLKYIGGKKKKKKKACVGLSAVCVSFSRVNESLFVGGYKPRLLSPPWLCPCVALYQITKGFF